MNPLDLQFWQQHQRTLGVLGIAIGMGAWAMEFAGTVYICPYCAALDSEIFVLSGGLSGGSGCRQSKLYGLGENL